jgi:hypothetical protein
VDWRKLLPTNWKGLLAWALITGAGIAAYELGYAPFVPSVPPVPVWEAGMGPESGSYGWVNDPDAVKAVASKLRFKVFGDTPAGKVGDPLPDHVYLWEIYRKADPRGPPIKNQGQVGSCVSFGTNQAILRTMAVAIALGQPFELKDIAEEVTYAGSRVEVGGGKIRGDGSVGAWAAQFVQRWGVVSREVHGQYDLTHYDASRCRSWGSKGVPSDLEAVAREHPVKEFTQVQDWTNAKKALASGYGIAVCSGQGFSMQRDSRGVARAQGSWGHCMCLDGYHVEGGKEYGHIQNSWGPDAHTGPVGWGAPDTGGFWAESAVVDRMLKAGDSWAFSSVQGFPSQRKELDWFVRNAPRPERDERFASLVLWRMSP